MQLFYAPDIEVPYPTHGEEESKHCVRVLRLSGGDAIHRTDGRGNLYRAEITDDHPKHCTVRILSTENRYGKLPYGLTVAVAPTKNADRFEWFLEKATEVGISSILPLETEHSERRTFRAERGEKVITAAMKQSLKAYRPELRPLTTFREAVLQPFDGQRFLDFSPEEIDLALAHGFVEITLGNQRLRTETAALTAVVMVAVANTLKPTE